MSTPEFPPRSDATTADALNPYHAPRAALESGDATYVSRVGETLNPWISIWTRPRATIRQIVDTNPTFMVLPLAMAAGVGQALDNASTRSLGDQAPLAAILTVAVILGPIGGLIGLYLFGALVRWTGSWIGGVATAPQVRAAFAWGQFPGVCGLVLWIPQLLLFGRELFTTEMPYLEANPMMFAVLAGIGLVGVVLGVWQSVLVIKCVAEVHEFSAWKGLGALFLAGLFVFAIIVIPLVVLLVATAGISA